MKNSPGLVGGRRGKKAFHPFLFDVMFVSCRGVTGAHHKQIADCHGGYPWMYLFGQLVGKIACDGIRKL